MKKTTFYRLMAFAVLSLVFIGCTSNEEQLRQRVEEMNRERYPMQVDNVLRLDSLSVMPGLTIGTYCTFLSMSKEDFTPEMIEMMRYELKVDIIKTAISDDKDAKRFRNAGVTFYYECKDRNGNHLVDVTVTPDEYKKAMKER